MLRVEYKSPIELFKISKEFGSLIKAKNRPLVELELWPRSIIAKFNHRKVTYIFDKPEIAKKCGFKIQFYRLGINYFIPSIAQIITYGIKITIIE
ncbi:hypothetical protein DERF_001234 [Dermatophagoides farinae]|uniref:Uncharacterized protein n=1 Tax=Dermatophagoides farinae TaxID=6954 RepID=A0A922L965_DERFA|nr:hypothetical protein DERF_001234 [Dermatophagoides farinae]